MNCYLCDKGIDIIDIGAHRKLMDKCAAKHPNFAVEIFRSIIYNAIDETNPLAHENIIESFLRFPRMNAG